MSFLPINGGRLQARHSSKIRGVQLAIVVDNKDGADNSGYRVKVKLPWLSDQESTFWARIAVPMGGPDRGTYVLPEIDDQVLVVFEHGDISRPIVIGGLWSKKQEPVEVNQSGKNNTKLIKSRAGHRIIFGDKEGAEKIVIVDKTQKNKIILDSVNKIVKIGEQLQASCRRLNIGSGGSRCPIDEVKLQALAAAAQRVDLAAKHGILEHLPCTCGAGLGFRQ